MAENAVGYRNLVKLSSAGFLEGFQRGKPTVDAGLMAAVREGVIALTGCLAVALLPAAASTTVTAEARALADELLQIFGHDNVYFEVQKNGIADQEKANEGIVRIARELGRPLVGTGDVHYLRREDYDNHTALLCVQTKSTLAAPKMTFDTNEFYLRSNDEMAEPFARVAGGARHDAGDRRALRCRARARQAADPALRLPGRHRSSREYLRQLVTEGLAWRFGDPVPAAALERAEYELGVIDRMGYSGYFLIVWDFIKYAQRPAASRSARAAARRPARWSPTRLQITDLDPLALRPAVRALPQPGARVDAGHRHRLLGARPRAGDPVRDRQVRQGLGRADHHVRQDVPARGDARRRPRARLPATRSATSSRS